MSIKAIRSAVTNYWQVGLSIFGGLAVVVGLLFYRLSKLLPAGSVNENAYLVRTHSLHDLLHNPLFALYRFGQYALSATNHLNLLSSRQFSACLGLVAVLLTFYVLKNWHDTRIAIIGAFLLASSSWFLHYARLAVPTVSYTLVIAAAAYGVWFKHARRPGLAIGLGVLVAAGFVYTPGLIWFVILALVWQRKTIMRYIALAPRAAIAMSVLAVLLLAPLCYAVYQQPGLIKPLLGLSNAPLQQLHAVPGQILHILSELAWHGHTDPVTGLSRLAVLDFFTVFMAVLGICSYALHRRLDRAKMLAGSLVLGILLVSLQGPVSILVLLPFIYLLASAGIAYMLDTWFVVFPRNPLAQSVGIGLIMSAVLLVSYYHSQRYFVAWPQAPATRQAFSRRP